MKVTLLGVEFNSGNRGCGALAYAAVEMIKHVCEEKKENLSVTAMVCVDSPVPIIESQNGIKIEIQLVKMAYKKLAFWKKCASEFASSDMIIDFSMGDSFADIYGKKRFYKACVLKELAIRSKKPFIMGPQTIGPFSAKLPQVVAKHIISKSAYCFVRDDMSARYTEELFGIKPILTTDVAFCLPYQKREKKESTIKRIGFNPSGLLYDGTNEFSASKHITVEYKSYVNQLMEMWTSKPDEYEVHLIPHVFSYDGVGPENDMRACMEIHKMYPNTTIESAFDTPMEVKSFISTMDVFVGARMHATIAAFSSDVAVIPFSYSRKFEGLYSDLDYFYLISATKLSTEEAVKNTIAWVDDSEVLLQKVKESQKRLAPKQKLFYDVLREINTN